MLIRVSFDEAAPHLRSALGEYFDEARQVVASGEECCYKHEKTYMQLRGEVYPCGRRELVVVGLAGDMLTGTQAAIRHAKQNGFTSIRAHFFRRGAERFIRDKINHSVVEIERRGEHERVLRIDF